MKPSVETSCIFFSTWTCRGYPLGTIVWVTWTTVLRWNHTNIRKACPFEDVNMKLVCHQNYPVPNRNEQGTYTLSAFLYIKESSLRLSACVFIIGPEMKLRLRNMSVHWCPCDWHQAGMSRWATGTGHDATKTFWLQSKHWKLLGIPSWWIQNKISWTLQTFYWASGMLPGVTWICHPSSLSV